MLSRDRFNPISTYITGVIIPTDEELKQMSESQLKEYCVKTTEHF